MTGGGSSIPEVRRLLSVLAAGRRCAEAGTAFGLGALALAETAAHVVTVELDGERADAAAARLRGVPNVELLVGDWRELLPPRAPFDLVFLDGGRSKADPAALGLVAPGGLLVMDDLTPDRPGPDPVRELWLSNPAVAAVEILTTPATAAIVAARRP